MSNARNLSKLKPSTAGLIESNDIEDGATTSQKLGTYAVTSAKLSADLQASTYGMKNRIINGDMRISQANNGGLITATTTVSPAAAYPVDRFYGYSSPSSKFYMQRNAGSATPPAGFTNYLGATSLSAYSVGASDACVLDHRIEGFNVADLGWGAASAQSVTLSFWVRSSLTGSFGGAVKNNAGNRSYPYSYTISAANTWEQKTITIPGDTTGTWLTDSGIGIEVVWGIGVGSTNSGTAGAWAAAGYASATGAVSVVGTSGATFYITGVQLEKGSTATSFDYRDYGRELIMCQRYYSLNVPGAGKITTTTSMAGAATPPVSMRAAPTISLINGTGKVSEFGVAARNITSIFAFEGVTVNGGNVGTTISTATSGASAMYFGDAFALTAEL